MTTHDPNHFQNTDHMASAGQMPSNSKGRVLKSLLLSVVIIIAALVGAAYISQTAPKANKRPKKKMAPLVQVIHLAPETRKVTVSAMGTVIPANEITLKSQVSGKVVAIHPEFTDGGFVTEGEDILKIDPQDYRLALAQRQRAVAEAEYAVKLEQGHQDVAKREWELLNDNQPAKPRDVELALRKPHLAKAEADLAAALADLEQAKLNLARTTIHAPFNALVRGKMVGIGSMVSTQDRLADLLGTDKYWVQVSVPVDRLEWILIPRRPGQKGAKVHAFHRNGHERAGRVIRLLGDLEAEGRMARILVEITDPLNLKAAEPNLLPLLIGEYIRVEIDGRQLDDVYQIPRTALRDNNSLWMADKNDRLEIRTVKIIWRDAQSVLVQNGLQPGDRLIVSDLAAAINGMAVGIAP